MQVVEVIPIVKGITKPTFSYFSKKKIPPGKLVSIPMRNGRALGIVEHSADAKQAKSSLKREGFALKKILLVDGNYSISQGFMRAVKETADFYATTIGSVLGKVIPKIILENPELLGLVGKEKPDTTKEVKLVQLSFEERFKEYRSIIRESLAKNSSVLFVVPTKEDSRKAEELLSPGIEQFVFSTVDKSEIKLKQLLIEAGSQKHPIILITTPTYIAFSRKDLGTVIVEKENSRAYRTLSRPYIDIKTFLNFYSKSRGFNLILGDSVLSLESLYLEKRGEYSELTPMTWRLKHKAQDEIIDMKAKKDFAVLSDRLVDQINFSLSENKKVFLFATRKGIASTTICGDCASLLLCKNCGAPLALQKDQKNSDRTFYICRHCGAKRNAEIRCDNCQSWKLTPLGIGIDRIEEECQKLFPDAAIFVLDKNRVATATKAKKTVSEVLAEPKAILIGTELAFQYFDSFPLVAAISLDSLFAIPDFFINERVFYLITKLREFSTERFIVQTRNAKAVVLENAAAGNILDFFRNEIEERKELKYPPFSIFIKVSTEDSRERIEKKASRLQADFKDLEPHFILESREGGRRQTLSMILRILRREWPSRAALNKLLLLTPDFLIKVDPESIF